MATVRPWRAPDGDLGLAVGCEAGEEGVGGGVEGLAGDAERGGGGAEEDEDVERVVGGEVIEGDGAVGFGAQDGVEVGVLLVGDAGVAEGSGGVDDAVDGAEGAADAGDCGAEGGGVGDVGLDDEGFGAGGFDGGQGLGLGLGWLACGRGGRCALPRLWRGAGRWRGRGRRGRRR